MPGFICILKPLLAACLAGLWTLTFPALCLAQDEAPDFSFFRDPNEGKPATEKTKTEAEPPCLSCQTGTVKKPAPIKVKKEEAECIACGRVKLNPVKTKSSLGADVWSQYPQIYGYSENPEVKAMISYAERHSRSTSGGMCYRAVKEALCRAPRSRRCKGGRLVSKYMSGTPVFPEAPSRARVKMGVNATRNLKAEGFINLLEDPEFGEMIKNPASAPKGAILIYQGGRNGGHIEIKTGHGDSGSYVSDFRAPNSVMKNELAGRASKNYRLVAVMIKPAEKLK